MSDNISIKEQIRNLVQLQKIDSEIIALEKEKKDKPEEIARFQERFNDKKAKAEEIKKETDTLLVKRKEQEVELATKEEAIKKSQQQLYTLKTNKEYTAMTKEIEGVKADKSVIEDVILTNFDRVDAKKNELVKETEHLKQEEQILNSDKKKVDDRIKEIDAELATLGNKRKQFAELVEPKLLARYEKLLSNRVGLAIVAVKNEACHGCFMNATPQVINEIKMYDKIIACQMCSRILYLDDELGD